MRRRRLLPARPLRAPRRQTQPPRRGRRPHPGLDPAHERRAQRGGARDGRRSTPTTRFSATATGGIRVDALQHLAPNATSFDQRRHGGQDRRLRRPRRRLHDLLRLRTTRTTAASAHSLRRRDASDADNANNTRRRLRHHPAYDCWNGSTPMHENGHNQGAVQYDAPYSTGDGAHCSTRTTSCATRRRRRPQPGHRSAAAPTASTSTAATTATSTPRPIRASTSPPTGTWARTANRFIELRRARRRRPGPHRGSAARTAARSRPPTPGTGRTTPTPVDVSPRSACSIAEPARRLTSAAEGGWRRYTFKVPRGSSRLVVTLDCAPDCPDQLDLYARGGSSATLTEYDCRSAGPGSDESCRVRTPRRGHLAHRRPHGRRARAGRRTRSAPARRG